MSNAVAEIENYSPITAKVAAEIGLSSASKFIDEPLLFNVNSTDYLSNSGIRSGNNGKRVAWNVFVGDRLGKRKMTFLIVNMKIEEFTYDDALNYEDGFILTEGTFGLNDILIDSSEAIKTVRREKGLKPGNPKLTKDWLIGYHYAVGDAIVANDFKTSLVIDVYGISPNGNFATVTIEQKTGDIIGSSEKVGEDQTGRSIWEAF